jgi:hypothetical protein
LTLREKDPGDLAVGRGFFVVPSPLQQGNFDARQYQPAIVKSVTASLPELANIIRAEHTAVAQAANYIVTHVLALGREFVAAQEPARRTAFEAWGDEVRPIDGVAP